MKLCFLILLLTAPFVLTQTTTPDDVQISTNTSNGASPPDVLFNIPNLNVGELNLTTSNLTARVHLDVNTANLVTISAGLDVNMEQVFVSLRGLQTRLSAEVRLDNIVTIVNRTLTSLDLNPSLKGNGCPVCPTTNQTNQTDSGVIILSDLINTEGQHVVTLIDQKGNITLNLINSTGMIIESIPIGTYLTELIPTGVILQDDNGNGTKITQYVYPPTGILVDIKTENGTVVGVAEGQVRSNSPTNEPTSEPTSEPTITPTTAPSPTNTPTSPATETPTSAATETPTSSATETPTTSATTIPTVVIANPTISTTEVPTTSP